MDANGFGTPTPLGGVEVCVARKRPYKALDFVETNGQRAARQGRQQGEAHFTGVALCLGVGLATR
ncbi:MAG TPA: hypothetical protein VF395_09960 [Polyangiaceae bacterium]